jgi:Protein of unknown function (DUF3102)
MNNIVTFPPSVNPDDTLEEHAAKIRKGLQDIRRTMSNALDIALAVGQRLNIAKDQVDDGKWGKWLRDDCELSRSTALLYMRLANHQGDIDAARVQLPDLSLRAARRLLTKSITPEAKESDAAELDQEEPEADGLEVASPDHTAALRAAWEVAPIEAQKEFLAAILAMFQGSLSDLFGMMPEALQDELLDRAESSLAAGSTTKKQREAINKARKNKNKSKKTPKYLEATAIHLN